MRGGQSYLLQTKRRKPRAVVDCEAGLQVIMKNRNIFFIIISLEHDENPEAGHTALQLFIPFRIWKGINTDLGF